MTVLAVDQGTSSTKAVLVDSDGAIVARGSAPLRARFPQPGWVEQDAEEIWAGVLSAIGDCLAAAPDHEPVALALTNQRESAVVWERATGRVAGPVIGWQDSRTTPECERLRAAGLEPLIRGRTGLALDPMFSATKLRWLLDRAPAGELCAGTIDAWLVHRLTGGEVFACEAGNASRTQLMDLRAIAWDAELAQRFGVPLATLPEIRRSDGGFGETVAAGALRAGLPIAAVLADSHAALYGHGSRRPGSGKATYGTGSSVMTLTAAPVPDSGGVAQTLAWLTDAPAWACEGNIIASGAALDWMAWMLGTDGVGGLETLAAEVDGTDGVHLVPAFAGLGAPYWDRGATGIVAGLTLGSRPAHLARAAFEAVALQICDVLDAVGQRLDRLHADGGATASGLLMQLQADLCGRPVLASAAAEMSALGVADLAAAALALREPALRPSRVFHPMIGEDERERRRGAWREAVERARV